jgi:acylglycerol lipase
MAHSMGGLITLTYVVHKQPEAAGLVVSAPLLKAKYAAPAWKVWMAKVLSRVAPSLTVSTGLDVSVPMSHDTALLKSFPDPELPHTLMSMRVGRDLLDVMPDTLSRARECTLPLLLLQGTDDGAVDPEATTEFYKNAGSVDKTLKIYPGFYHEIMNELERATVMGDILAWLGARSG